LDVWTKLNTHPVQDISQERRGLFRRDASFAIWISLLLRFPRLVNSNKYLIFEINPNAGATKFIGLLGNVYNIGVAMVGDPNGHYLYVGCHSLYRIDIQTANVTLFGSLVLTIRGDLAFGPISMTRLSKR